jgi:hypothetical protein
MRLILLLLAGAATLVAPASGEEVTVLPEIVIGGDAAAKKPGTDSTGRPEVVIGGGAANVPPRSGKCAEATSGGTMDCLNQKLKREVERVSPVENLPPIDARSSDIKTGVANIPAVRQQYGRNFGVSVVPYRPAPPVFSTPGVHR